MRVTWACSSTARWACELRSRRPRKFFHLRRLRQVRWLLGRQVAAQLVSVCVIIRLDYGNAKLLNAVARLVCDLHPREHVTSTLIDLHWLPRMHRIQDKHVSVPVIEQYYRLQCTSVDFLHTAAKLHTSASNYLRCATHSELFVPRTCLRVGELFSGHLQTNLLSLASHFTSARPLWSLDWDLPLPFLNPVYEPKSTVHLLTLAFTITNQKVTANHCTLHIPSTAPMLCMLFVFIIIVFMYYFTCISMLFGPRAASLLLNWLIDWTSPQTSSAWSEPTLY